MNIKLTLLALLSATIVAKSAVTFTPIWQYPNAPSPLDSYLAVWSSGGAGNFNSSWAQIKQSAATNDFFINQMLTNSSFLSRLLTNNYFKTNFGIFISTNLANISTPLLQTNISSGLTRLPLDYSQWQNFEIFSTRTNTSVLTIDMTNVIVLTNRVIFSSVIIHNLSPSNLLYTLQNTNWVSQGNANSNQPTNCSAGSIQILHFNITPAVTNNGIVGSVN